jgi:hypothetical protein
MLPLAADVTGSAVFGGPRDCYRYSLDRRWSDRGRVALFIMMNPSCANPLMDDRTIAGIQRKVRQWDWRGIPHAFGALLVANTFAYRARGPQVADRLLDRGHTLHALKVTGGMPWHPLYVADSTEPLLWQRRAA